MLLLYSHNQRVSIMSTFPSNVLYNFLEKYLFRIINSSIDLKQLVNNELKNFKVIGYHYLDEKIQHEHTELHLHQIKYIEFSSYQLQYSHDNIIKVKLIGYKEIVFNVEVNEDFISAYIHNHIVNEAIEEEYKKFMSARVALAQSIYHNKIMELGGEPKRTINDYDIIEFGIENGAIIL